MKIQERNISVGAETIAATLILADSGDPPGVISFHGHGATASRSRIRYILDYLAGYGISSACFDFSGNGESTGSVSKATLRTRANEAVAATSLLITGRNLTVIGTSMGGHIASVVAPIISPQRLIFFCPAAYAANATDLNLDDSFSGIARRPGAHIGSPAYAGLRQFRGDLLIFAASEDAVISREVTLAYRDAARLARSVEVVWVQGSEHKIHTWIQSHDYERAMVLEKVRSFVQRDAGAAHSSTAS